MQSQPLLISSLIEFAERHHGDAEIVSRRVEGDIHRYTYRDLAARARRLANALDAQQLQFSDRVATLAWNGYRHMEMYFGVSGSGRVLHTINPRLHPDQIAWIVNHAEDQVLCFDMTFLPLVQAVHAKCPTVKQWVALCDADKLPADTGIPGCQLRGLDWRAIGRLQLAASLMKTPHPACATPAAPQATPRRRCTATAPPRCTPTLRRCPM
jgi:acyl-CoA synthetase (AMP-forming)/AMP-acid ligase II